MTCLAHRCRNCGGELTRRPSRDASNSHVDPLSTTRVYVPGNHLDPVRTKTVIVLRADLTPGIAANTAAVLAVTLGAENAYLVGPDIPDADGTIHKGLITTPVPVLSADAAALTRLAGTPGDVAVIGFTATAARSKTYDTYSDDLSVQPSADLAYLGIALVGPAKQVTRLTGDFPLHR